MNMVNDQFGIPETKNMKELQKKLEGLALKIGSYYKLELDFSIESIKRVEKILSKVSRDCRKTRSEEGLKGIALELSAYMITVIEKNIVSGEWNRDSKEFGKYTYPYDLGGGNLIFPYLWCLKRIYDGEGEDVWVKFNTLVLKNKQI